MSAEEIRRRVVRFEGKVFWEDALNYFVGLAGVAHQYGAGTEVFCCPDVSRETMGGQTMWPGAPEEVVKKNLTPSRQGEKAAKGKPFFSLRSAVFAPWHGMLLLAPAFLAFGKPMFHVKHICTTNRRNLPCRANFVARSSHP